MSRFGPILGTPESESKIGIERGVRVWAPFDAVLSDRSDPRRFRSAWNMIYRVKHSLVASDDISAISRDLARFEPHLASLQSRASRCASERLRWHERLLRRALAACIERP